MLWKVNIEGEGHSSPVVTESEVIVTTAVLSSTKMKFNSIIFSLLIVLMIGFILMSLYTMIKHIRKNKDHIAYNFIFDLIIIVVYGLLVFAFCIIYWMYFNENRNEGGRIISAYFFSGSVFFLSLFMMTVHLPKKSMYRIFTGVIVIFLAILLVKYHPLPEYYTTKGLFAVENFPLFQLVVSSVCLPVIFSFVLILKTISKRNRTQRDLKHCFRNLINKRLSFSFVSIVAPFGFLIGALGFMSIPLMSLAKLLYRYYHSGKPAPFQLGTLFDLDFSYPFFLGVISIGILLWFLLESKRNPYEPKRQINSFTIITCCSAALFIILNFGISLPEYQREIICVDRNTGAIKWKNICFSGPAVSSSVYNSQATPTPLIDNSTIYAYFGSAGIIATDRKGKTQWENTGLPFEGIHGVGASPIFSKNGIILLNSMSKTPFLTSLNLESGKRNWTTTLPAWSGMHGEHRTPILYELDGQELILEWNLMYNRLSIYEASSGEVFCQFETNWETRGVSVSTPIISQGVLYLPNIMNVVAIDMLKLLNGESPILWKSQLKQKGPKTSSPVLSNGMLFMVSDHGIVTCMNSQSGEILWQKKLNGIFYSSPITIGNKVYFSNTKGVTTVLECSSEYRMIAENQLNEGINSTLVPVDGKLFIRTENTLWCLKQ